MNKNLLLRYRGYKTTPLLWLEEFPFPWKQLKIDEIGSSSSIDLVVNNKPLGKVVEDFLFYQLSQLKSIEWIKRNIQIQKGNKTIGELDALLYYNDSPIHLEVVYKFYLFDILLVHDDPISNWIGPNRNDALIYKLDKLKNKQFPLLFNEATQPYLEKHKLIPERIKQHIYFKAQLFLPYHSRHIDVKPLNKDCVAGFYISYIDISVFKDFQFYILKKLDWLVSPHLNVEWLDFKPASININEFIKKEQSPLIWIRDNDNEINKCFITWW